MERILIIEDNLVELITNATALINEGYTVDKVGGIDTAYDLLTVDRAEPYNCVIIDLNMSNKYLSADLKPKTHGGSLTGWVWLYYVARPLLINNPKIIIYSEFINELEDRMKNTNDEERQYFKSSVCISKAAAVNAKNLLITEVNKIFNYKRKL